jgi:dynein light intermediate chain 1
MDDEDSKPKGEEEDGRDVLSDDEDDLNAAIDMIPLEEGVLTINIGIPLIVVCNKSDILIHGEMAGYFKTRIDFVMHHVRTFALMFGGSVFSLSAHKNRGVDEFYRYLMHRCYGFDFPFKPELRDKEGILIPSGFDNPALANQLGTELD